MVSLLWKACSEGDLQKVQELLEGPNGVDVELKDYTGVTPLIEAVKNGHVGIVKLLLDKGADPTNASKDGRPESYTSEPAILDLLQIALSKVPPPQSPYTSDGTDKHFYTPPPPPPDAYVYYPPMNPSMNEGPVYYLPPPNAGGPVSPNNGIGHLPPPDIARMIPCRYFPACRYGSQCMFLHPQGPYYQGAMPPYPTYDPMSNPYGHYYPPPPPFQQPLTAHPVPPMASPQASVLHHRSPSDVVSPVQPPFSPNGSVPPSSNYAPPIYPPPGQLSMPYPIPQPPTHPHPDHHSRPNLYDAPPIVSPYSLPPDGPYHSQRPLPNGHYTDPVVGNAGESTHTENTTHLNGVNGINHHRRGSMRHLSFGSRKPPCLFFPSGRCKNGDECRFPHILPDGVTASTQSNLSQGKGGPSRASRVSQSDGPGSLVDKLSNLNLRDDQKPTNGIDGSVRPYTSENGHRLKSQANGKHHYQPGLNGHAKKSQPMKQLQRVPNADEFPVLAGSVTPPKLVNGNGSSGLTAAQVLQAPPPARKDGSGESSTRDPSPEPGRVGQSKELKPDTNGHLEKFAPPDQHMTVPSNKLPVVSFAAAAAARSVAGADAVKEVSVSA